MEKMFQEVGKSVATDTLLPTPQMTSEELMQLQSIAEKYGQKLYPPDYFNQWFYMWIFFTLIGYYSKPLTLTYGLLIHSDRKPKLPR